MSNAENQATHVSDPSIAFRAKLPTLSQPYIQYVRVCACFPLSDSALCKLIEQSDKTIARETRFSSAQGPAWIRVAIDRIRKGSENCEPMHGRLQIDCKPESLFRPSRADEMPLNSIEEVQQFLEMFAEQNVSVNCCEAIFDIPQDKLPPRGFVELMLELSPSVGNAKMNLTGATFDIQGQSPFDELKWKWKPKRGKNETDHLEVVITASPATINEIGGYPEVVASILFNGVRKLVIEQEE